MSLPLPFTFQLEISHFKFACANMVFKSLLLNTYFLQFCLLKFTEYVASSIKYVVLSRPRIMIRHICSISVYIWKLVTSTFIFIGPNGIFQILFLKNVFSGPILYLVSFYWSVVTNRNHYVSLRQPKSLAETFFPNFLLQFISRFNPL